MKKSILAGTAALFILAGLFPPWLTVSYQGHTYASACRFILSPLSDPREGVRLDAARLLIEWACILAGGTTAWIIFVLPGGWRTRPPRIVLTDDERKDVPPPVTPVTSGVQTAAPQAITPETVMRVTIPVTAETELRKRVADYVSTEFRQSEPQYRERAGKFIFGRIRFAAQYHIAEHQTLDRFDDSDYMQKAAAQFKELSRQAISRNSRPLRIVQVNDEPFVLEMFDLVIRGWFKDANVLSFSNGAAALEELSQTDPDLLITDDKMPVMDGNELCERLLDRNVTYPIIVNSAWGPTEQWVRELANRGLNVTFLPMPSSMASLRDLVEVSLKIPRDTVEKPVGIDAGTIVGCVAVAAEAGPPVVASSGPSKHFWQLTPKILNWVSGGLLASSVITIAMVLQGGNINEKAVEKLTELIGRILIVAGIFAWMARKRGKGYALLTFSVFCSCGVAIFAYYFHVGRETAKERDKQWAENSLGFYTNAKAFVQNGGTGSVPEIKLIGDPGYDAISQFMKELVSGMGGMFGRMNDEIDALGKRDVFDYSVLGSKEVLQEEVKKRTDSLKALEKYRNGLVPIIEECKSKVGTPGLTEEQRLGILQGIESSLQSLAPKYDNVLNARATREKADRDFLQFMIAAFDDYELKGGKILFGNDANSAKYKELGKGVTDAANEMEALVKKFLSDAEAGKTKIREIGDGGGTKR